MLRSTTLAIVLIAIANSSQALRYHVDLDATGSANGLTWANAFTNLQDVLSIVVPGDEIWVAAGQYKPTTGTIRTISFQVRNGVDLYGGFAGNETDLAQRDIAANPTVLNGDIGEPGSGSDNSHTVVTANNITTTVIMDGFRIMNGYSAEGSGYHGGGLRVTNILSGELILRNCSVINNFSGTYGGGLYRASARLTIENCEFNNNQAGLGNGGAMYNGNVNGSGSILTIRDSRFKNNSARVGACLDNSQAFDELVIDRCIFTNNYSEYSILDIGGFESAGVRNSYVIGNTVDGSISNALQVNDNDPDQVFSMINCTVAHNSNLYTNSIQEPMLQFFNAHHVIQNCIIHGNTAVAGRQVSADVNVSNSIVQGGHVGGMSIIDADPSFTFPHTGPQTGFDATDLDYTVYPASPAVNVGSNDAVLAPYVLDLALLPRIQGGVVDLGCYETDQTVGIGGNGRTVEWYFDATSGDLHLPAPTSARTINVHDTSGKLITSFVTSGSTHHMDLPTGVYVATTPAVGALRFATE